MGSHKSITSADIHRYLPTKTKRHLPADLQRRLLYIILVALSFFALGINAKADALSPLSEVANFELGNSETSIIGIGESLRLEVRQASKIHISDGGILRARSIGSSIILTGRRTGRTSMRFVAPHKNNGRNSETPTYNQDRTVFVTERKVAEAARRFQQFLTTRRGLKLDSSALPQIVVTGELLRLEDWANLVAIAKTHRIAWRLEANTFPPLRRVLRNAIDTELRKLAWPGDFLRIDDSGIKLTSGMEGPKHSASQLLAVTSLGLSLETSSTLNELEPMVRTQIVLAEIRRSKRQLLGIRWPQELSVGAASSFVVSSESLTAKIEALENSGDGRILAMPNLLCRSGGEAKFFAGGEIPIKISTLRTSQVEWKKYGIMLHVQPRADRLGRLKFQLSTEISSLDGANKVDTVPGILTNRIDTQFNLKGTQTVVLSGLIKKEESKSVSGVALLNSIPILGRLFESQDFNQNLTELLVFVTPEVYFPNATSEGENEFD